MHIAVAGGVLKLNGAMGSVVTAVAAERAASRVLLDVVSLIALEDDSRERRRNIDRASRLSLDVTSEVRPVSLKIRVVELPALSLWVTPV